ncbi:permease [Limnoglobus roseus]|uniref:Permease n=1 Tax=Limnoglobus roseus TaxID=2598579 RepID=A0A5C1AS08_9BACT|nr:permease [Limnoglobus roseus]QEL20014.1 permease [Limnoglobus roseus]
MVDQIRDFLLTFSSILWEAMPFIVLGAIVAGILEELLPQQWITKFMPKAPLASAAVGGALGLIFPMCECGIVVVMRRLLKKGLPLSCCIAYMLAGPIMNVVVLLSTYYAFKTHEIDGVRIGVDMVLLRALGGFLIATITGVIVYMMSKKTGVAALVTATAMPSSLPMADDDDAMAPGKPKPLIKRLSNISSTALHDFMDITVFLILGAILAAVAKMSIQPGTIERMSQDQPFLAIPLMMLLAVLMCLCSEADAFVAASFTKMAVSAKLAFLVLGPMLDLKLLMMFTRVFRARLIATIVVCVVTLSLLYSIVIHVTYRPITGPLLWPQGTASPTLPVDKPAPIEEKK